MPRAKIVSVGGVVPPKVLTNFDLEKMIDTSNDWIVERTGIHQRHIAEKGVTTSDLCVEAAQKCLAQANVDPKDLDLIIVATITPDMLLPATACLVQKRLGSTKAWGFDMSIACCGFIYALQVGGEFIKSGAHKNVLVIGLDVMSSIIDFTDRQTCIIFGDGGVHLDHGDAFADHRLDWIDQRVDAKGLDRHKIPGFGRHVVDGFALFVNAQAAVEPGYFDAEPFAPGFGGLFALSAPGGA